MSVIPPDGRYVQEVHVWFDLAADQPQYLHELP